MVKLCVVMDPIETINPKKDSTLALMLEAQKRNWQIFYLTPQDIFISQGQVFGVMRQIQVADEVGAWFKFLDEPKTQALHEHDVTLMRKDPPFNMNYLYATIFLDLAQNQNHLVVNAPQALRDANEKLFTGWFHTLCPETLVTSKLDLLKAFIVEQKKIVVKPLDSMGGQGVFLLEKNDLNISAILETLTQNGTIPIMAQRFIPEIKKGDKRIIMIDGKPFPYGLARIPAKGELRGNLAVGGSGVGFKLSKSDLALCEQIGPTLKDKGLLFAGLDVIGDKLTEINVTSPTCIREIDAAFDVNVSKDILDAIEEKL